VKYLIAVFFLLSFGAFAGEPSAPTQPAKMHRYIIERTFPRGALDHLDSSTKAKVNQNNTVAGVRWVQSYANPDETKTYCIYEGPNEAAVRKAAELNSLPVDSITEVPIDLDSETGKTRSAAVQKK
jgi:hypothetical protein